MLRGCVLYVCCYVKKKSLLHFFANTERRDMGLYEVPLSMSLGGGGGWDGDYVSQYPYVWYYAFVKSYFKHALFTVLYCLLDLW